MRILNKLWLEIRSRALVRDTITTTFWSTLGRGVGFLIPFFIAAWFGVSSETDSFFFAYSLILFLANIFAPVVQSIIVPYIAETRKNNEDVGKFVGKILSVSSVGLLGLAVIVILVIKPVLSVITRFDQQTLNFIHTLIFETSPLIVFLVWTSILTGALNAYKKFAFPAVSPAFRAVVNLSIIFIFREKIGVHAIALGYVVGEIVRLIILLGVIKRLKILKLSLSLQLGSRIREFLKTGSFQAIGMVALGFNTFINNAMASWLATGSVSILHYANRLYMIPTTFISTGLLVTLLSHWSGRYYKSGIMRLKEDVEKAVKTIGIITLPITTLLIFFRQPIVNLAFGRGAFALEKLPEVGWVWVCYLLGFLPYIIRQVYVRAHLALKNTKALMQISFCSFVLQIVFNYILMRPLKVAGIALATSFVSLFGAMVLGTLFYKRVEKEGLKL
ncbi:Lipid II flippase MurJ [subsurface metagenome]